MERGMQLLGLGERYKLTYLPSLINYVGNIDEKGEGQSQLSDFKCIIFFSCNCPQTHCLLELELLIPLPPPLKVLGLQVCTFTLIFWY